MKNIRIILLLILVSFMLAPATANSSNGGVVGSGTASGDSGEIDCANEYDCISLVDPTEDLIKQICEFRQMFCGGVAVVLVSLVFVFIGILTLMQKINWGFVLVMITASIVFVQADRFAALFAPGVAIECSC